jgi:hypothetical protein
MHFRFSGLGNTDIEKTGMDATTSSCAPSGAGEAPARHRPLRTATLASVAAAALLAAGCVTTDPYTGQRQVDAGSTALAVGALAAVGGVAYLASKANDKDDHGRNNWNRYSSPRRDVRCYPDQRACYDRNGYSAWWTRQEFGNRRR